MGWGWLEMKRKIYLDILPRKGRVIDWKNSVGTTINFAYEEIEGQITITNYINQRLEVEYENEKFKISTSNLSTCTIGAIIGKYRYSYEYKYAVGDIIENLKSGKLKILAQTNTKRGSKGKNVRTYLYECLICGHSDTISEGSINYNGGCGVCASKKVKIGFNDIWTTNRELGEILWNPNDGYKYTTGSKTKVDWKCPNCQLKIQNKEIYSIKDQGLSCPKCSDGISYPNKIMYHILAQTKIEFENEWSPKWAEIKEHKNKNLTGRKKFDFYIPSLNCVIEMHGIQHFTEAKKFTKTHDEEMENDRLKEKLLYENGVGYFSIDAQESELEYIKNNILENKLAKLIDFSKIDWNKCDKDSSKSLMVEACELFRNENLTTTEIGLRLHLVRKTIIRYLKRGTKMGLCNYSAEEESRKSRIKGNAVSAEKSKKPVIQFSMDGEIINEFDSAREASKFLRLSFSVISAACVGKQQSAGGFRWMYKEDYISKEENINSYSIKRKSSPVVRMTLDGHYISEYESMKDATEELGISHTCISDACKGKQKTAGGYNWMYKRDYYEKIT